jgi:type IV pilus assembly protein PilB
LDRKIAFLELMNSIAITDVKAETLQVLSPDQAWHYRIFPKEEHSDRYDFYIDEAAEMGVTEVELEMLLGKSITLLPISAAEIQKALSKYYRTERQDNRSRQITYDGNGEDFLGNLIYEAKTLKSSDIHIETYEEKCRVRIRIDGMLVERYVIDKTDYPSLINKIKIMSNLDIAEKRLPQDGRIAFHRKGTKFDIRVSVLPTLYGEKIVLRILSNDATNIDIYKLGFSEFDLHNFLEGVKRPNGILLISGPTGSGKTTTLYATLKLLNKETRNLLTIEDPIEYTLEGINQVQLKENIGLNFGTTLRTFLRQDPDIIMVGEIRDEDTATMAIRLALTGHLVLSTIHTNSAWGTISRLIDMGIPSFLVANTLNTTAAQRLLRLLCPACKKTEPFDRVLFPRQFKPYRDVEQHCLPVGCELCHHTGYKGRKAVYEVIPVDAELSEMIKNNRHDVADALKERGVKTLAENAFELFEKGETSIDEIYPLLLNF